MHVNTHVQADLMLHALAHMCAVQAYWVRKMTLTFGDATPLELDTCLATSAARLVLSCALHHGVPGHLLPAGHVGGAPYDGLWEQWVRWVSVWGGGPLAG